MTAWSAGVELIWNSNNLTVAGKYRFTIVSGYFDTPPVRGENLIIPFVSGRTFIPKFQDQVTILCKGDIQGTSQTDLEANIATLKGYFADLAQHTLTRNLPDGSTQKSNTTTEARNFICTPNGPLLAIATVDFICSVAGFS